ncbi:MAG: Fe-S protein assembly co-chaperone HscB [Rickettsiales bacterium]|nr:Fe-S protein assembly co-chaperone HscB [Rickettsiales bacterium]
MTKLVDHFSLLGLTPAFDLDLAELEKAYFREQRRFHPDRFVGKPPHERNAALQRSVDINQAYHTLKNPLTRAQALLKAQAIEVGGDHDTVKPTQSLLMETLAWREAIDEAQTPEAAEAAQNTLQTALSSCLSQLSALYGQQNWPDMAQSTLRLGYIEKALQAATQKAKKV